MLEKFGKRRRDLALAGVLGITLIFAQALVTTATKAAEPIKVGFSMALTGALAGGGKQALVSMEMWAEDINKKGGLLDRPVELVYYDDQTNPKNVPGIYAKSLINEYTSKNRSLCLKSTNVSSNTFVQFIKTRIFGYDLLEADIKMLQEEVKNLTHLLEARKIQ